MEGVLFSRVHKDSSVKMQDLFSLKCAEITSSNPAQAETHTHMEIHMSIESEGPRKTNIPPCRHVADQITINTIQLSSLSHSPAHTAVHQFTHLVWDT